MSTGRLQYFGGSLVYTGVILKQKGLETGSGVARLWGALVQQKLGAFNCEARIVKAQFMSEVGVRFGVGQRAPSHQIRVWGSAVSSPVGSGQSPSRQEFGCFFAFSDDLSCYEKSCVHCASVSLHSFLSLM